MPEHIPTDRISLRVSAELAAALRRRADELGLSPSSLVRDALAAFLGVPEAAPVNPNGMRRRGAPLPNTVPVGDHRADVNG